MSITQCRLFSIAQWLRMTGPSWSASQRERGDVEAGLAFDPVGDLACALDHDDALQPRPLVALLEPPDVVDRGGGPGLDAAVITLGGAFSTTPCRISLNDSRRPSSSSAVDFLV